MFKKVLLFLLAALVVIQFFHPKKNKAEGPQPNAIAAVYGMPENVRTILSKACFDCHSNNTRYPWYARIQPVHWWMNNHINEGKEEVNFDEYGNKPLRYQYHKMEETIEMVKKGDMPLNSYTWIHKDAILTDEEKTAVENWATGVMDTLKAHYPMDSLIRKKQPQR